eukprot:m.101737 g.101737  ORF g.101737 m.101737 type:complete len:58 (+) comp14984_c1_seq4:1531-1704(+)
MLEHVGGACLNSPLSVIFDFCRFQRVSSHRSSIIPINIADSARFHSPTHRLLSSSET